MNTTAAEVRGPQTKVHPSAAGPDSGRMDVNAGTIETADGRRVLRAGGEFVTGLLAGLDAEVGDAAGEILYQCGRRWGAAEMTAFAGRAEQEFGVAFDKIGMGTALESWWWPFRVAGWGTWRYDFRRARQGLILVDLDESAVAKAVGQSGRPACHVYAGLFAAAFGHLAKRDLAGVELRCAAAGADRCQFLVSTARRTGQAAAWRNEGAATDDILHRLSHPEAGR